MDAGVAHKLAEVISNIIFNEGRCDVSHSGFRELIELHFNISFYYSIEAILEINFNRSVPEKSDVILNPYIKTCNPFYCEDWEQQHEVVESIKNREKKLTSITNWVLIPYHLL